MSQLLWGKQKGPFAAPPEWTKKRSPWAYLPLWLLLPATVIFIAFSLPTLTAFYSCSTTVTCAGVALPALASGSYQGVAFFTGGLMAVAVVLGVVAAFRLKRWPVWVCWPMAALGLVLAIAAFLMLIGSIPTPVGEVIPETVGAT